MYYDIEGKADMENIEEKYKKLRRLGAGATAEVFLVEEVRTKQYYAMKISRNEELLEQEANLLLKLNHPMFPRLKEYSSKNREYLVMEYIEGTTLQEIMSRGDVLSVSEMVYIMDELLKGLNYLHLQTPCIVFRDLKPANIIIEKTGRIRLIDFGAACYGRTVSGRSTQTALPMAGTYGYAAPEQFWAGVELSKGCDIYAAGKVFAYLLSGKNPAEPPYDMETYCKGLKKVPVEFMNIIERSLAMEPQARFEDCESMRRKIHSAYEIINKKRLFKVHKKSSRTYKKCVWMSEYRRIF